MQKIRKVSWPNSEKNLKSLEKTHFFTPFRPIFPKMGFFFEKSGFVPFLPLLTPNFMQINPAGLTSCVECVYVYVYVYVYFCTCVYTVLVVCFGELLEFKFFKCSCFVCYLPKTINNYNSSLLQVQVLQIQDLQVQVQIFKFKCKWGSISFHFSFISVSFLVSFQFHFTFISLSSCSS